MGLCVRSRGRLSLLRFSLQIKAIFKLYKFKTNCQIYAASRSYAAPSWGATIVLWHTFVHQLVSR